MSCDPYDVLGVPRGAPFSEVRTQYFRLARKHHPDKLVHVSEEERRHHEEIFKKVSAAYDAIERAESGERGPGERDWRTVWSKVESLFQRPEVWDCVQKVFKETVADVLSQAAENKKREMLVHTVYLPITLEDMHKMKNKKVQIFLQDVKEPVITRVSCLAYPQVKVKKVIGCEEHTIHVHMHLQDHAVFRFDDIFGKWDLYTDVHVSWSDYVTGKEVVLPRLDDTDTMVVNIPPFPRMDVPLLIEGAGVAGKGDLYVSLQWQLPTRECWERIAENDKKDFMQALDALSA